MTVLFSSKARRHHTVRRSRCRARTSSGRSPLLTSSATDLKGRLAGMRLALVLPTCFRLSRSSRGAWLMLIVPADAVCSPPQLAIGVLTIIRVSTDAGPDGLLAFGA